MGYRMKTLKYLRYDGSIDGGSFTNSATVNTTLSTGVGIFTPQVPGFAGTGVNGPCSGQDSNIAEVDVTGASAPGTIYIYYTSGAIPANGQPPNPGDIIMAEINYGTGAFTYKASWVMACSQQQGALYIAISSPTASATVSIAQFRLTVLIKLFALKA